MNNEAIVLSFTSVFLTVVNAVITVVANYDKIKAWYLRRTERKKGYGRSA